MILMKNSFHLLFIHNYKGKSSTYLDAALNSQKEEMVKIILNHPDFDISKIKEIIKFFHQISPINFFMAF